MASETAKMDDNFRRALIAVTDDVNAYLKNLLVDPVTGRLKVTAIVTSGGGITSLNALTGGSQTFADVDDTNVTLTIASVGTTHTFTIGWSGQLAIARGGTGAATAQAGFDALSPTTTEGDIIFRNATVNTRLAKGTAGQVLTMNAGATAPEWQTPTAAPTNFADNVFYVSDNGDSSKRVAFQVSGVTTSTTRTLTVQDADGTIYITGGTDVAVADGGTGASDAGTARTNLGLAIGTNVQAYSALLAAIAGMTPTDGNIIVGDGATFVAESGATARTSLGLGTGDSPTFTNVTASTALITDTLSEKTAANGVTIDGLKLKDSGFAIGSDADGDIYYRASGALARLAKGTASQVLKMNSGATAPEWGAPTAPLPPCFVFPVEIDGANAFLYGAARPFYTDDRNVWIYTSSSTVMHLVNMASGGDVQTRTSTTDLSGAAYNGFVKIGNYLYAMMYHGTTPKVRRYSLTDLTTGDDMTVSGTAIGVESPRLYSDGTSLWINNTGGDTNATLHIFRNYTISGTTLTAGSTITCGSTSANFTQASMDSSGNFYGADASGKLYRHNSSGTLVKTGARNLGNSGNNNLYASIEGTPFMTTLDTDAKTLMVWKAPLIA